MVETRKVRKISFNDVGEKIS